MAKGRKNGRRKRRTREHVIADLAVNYMERFVLRCGYTMGRVLPDYGLDGAIATYDSRGEVENGLIWCQIKATDACPPEDATVIKVRVERKDLLYWMGERYPVILVLYVAPRDEAYWLHVQADVGGGKLFELARAGSKLTVNIQARQKLNEDAIREFRRFKMEIQRAEFEE